MKPASKMLKNNGLLFVLVWQSTLSMYWKLNHVEWKRAGMNNNLICLLKSSRSSFVILILEQSLREFLQLQSRVLFESDVFGWFTLNIKKIWELIFCNFSKIWGVGRLKSTNTVHGCVSPQAVSKLPRKTEKMRFAFMLWKKIKLLTPQPRIS